MVYPTPFLRLVVIGTLYGKETFTYSLSLAPTGGGSNAPSEVPAGVISALTTFHTDTQVACGNQTFLTAIKLNEIGTNGRYVSQSDTVMHEFETGIAGGAIATLPAQCALAITLRTDIKRGRAHSGRFYIPRLGGPVANTGFIPAAQVTGLVTASTALLNSLNAAVPGYAVAVMSDIGTGARRFVRNVEVGQVVDTIRSRRTSLDEARVAGPELGGWTGGGGPF